ncbi:Hyccin [Turdus rufiventris]|nr:Hyccin [Turdus rufiventris]
MLAVDTGLVEEWLSEFKTLPEASISSYATGLKDKTALISSLYKVIQEPQSEEIVDKEGHSKVLSFTIPSLSKPSVYHEPSSIGSMALTEGALSQHGLSRVVYSGPHPQREMLTAQNRICVCGYPRQQVRKYKGVNSRIPVSSEFMVQMLTGIYYAFYNGEWDLARKAMDDVLYRAQLELYPEPLLVANAIKASLPQGAMKSSKEDNSDLAIEEELIEVSETDEGFYSRATSGTSQSALSNSSTTSSKNLLGKSQRRSGGSKPGGKEKEGETCREHLSRKQTQRAMSENLELVSLKRLTLTTSQSLPKPGSHSLARTTTTVFSKSFEQVSGVPVPNNRGGVSGTEANRFSACSLQEEKLIYGTERTDLPILSKQPNQQRPPSISITLSTD